MAWGDEEILVRYEVLSNLIKNVINPDDNFVTAVKVAVNILGHGGSIPDWKALDSTHRNQVYDAMNNSESRLSAVDSIAYDSARNDAVNELRSREI